MISLEYPADTAITTLAQPAATGGGQAVLIGVPVILILLLAYLCKHKKHKISTAVIAALTGILLGGTQFGYEVSTIVVSGVVNLFGLIGDLFS